MLLTPSKNPRILHLRKLPIDGSLNSASSKNTSFFFCFITSQPIKKCHHIFLSLLILHTLLNWQQNYHTYRISKLTFSESSVRKSIASLNMPLLIRYLPSLNLSFVVIIITVCYWMLVGFRLVSEEMKKWKWKD